MRSERDAGQGPIWNQIKGWKLFFPAKPGPARSAQGGYKDLDPRPYYDKDIFCLDANGGGHVVKAQCAVSLPKLRIFRHINPWNPKTFTDCCWSEEDLSSDWTACQGMCPNMSAMGCIFPQRSPKIYSA